MSMTVKWITTYNGIERTRIFEAENVEAFYADTIDGKMPVCCDSAEPGPAPSYKHHDYDLTRNTVFIDAGPGGIGHMLTEGRVYVMNREGRTVGNYDLGYIQDAGPSIMSRQR